MNTSADANRRPEEGARGPADRPRPGGGLRRRLLLAGAAVCLAAAGLLAAKYLYAPWAAREETPAPQARAPSPAGQKPSGPVTPASPPSVATPASPATVQELRDEAFAVVRQLMAEFPRSARAVSCMGSVYAAFKDPDEAETWWRKALELDPTQADAYVLLAETAAARGDFEKAEGLWRKAQEIAPRRPGVHMGYAAALLAAGKPDEAIEAIHKELALSPDNRQCSALLGTAYSRRKEYEKAVEHYQRATEDEWVDPAVFYGLATAHARLAQKDKADACMEKFRALQAERDEQAAALKRMATDRGWVSQILAQTLTDAGTVYAENGKWQRAEAGWRRASLLDPRNTACRHSLVGLYSATGRLPEAVTVCEQLRQIAPRDAANEMNIGVLLARLKQFDAAEAAMRKAFDLGLKTPAGHRSLVRLLLSRNRNLPEARTWAEKLVALEPSAPNYLLLAQACHRAGDLPAARAALERALQLEPDNENVKKAYRVLQEGK